MRHLFEKEGRALVEMLAAERALLAFDFDGTLAPIVDDPGSAFMRPKTAKLLSLLARAYPCAVISGRGRDDLLLRLFGIEIPYVVGNHGAEWGRGELDIAEEPRDIVRSFRVRLTEALAGLEGATIEDKGLSIAIHLRGPSLDDAELRVARCLESVGPARVFGGKRVVNVLPLGVPHKGAALARIVREQGAGAALYVGDDTTDEDAFGNPGVVSFCPVRVGASETSRAAYFLRDQGEVDWLLEQLLELRRGA